VGAVTFKTTHLSRFAVAWHKVDFVDVPGDSWYAKAVAFIAAREITLGPGPDTFSPAARLTRGQFIVMLMRAMGIAADETLVDETQADETQADKKQVDNFSDAGNTYYTGCLAAARRLGITAGVGNNLFAPDREITRQEMFAMRYHALQVMGPLLGEKTGNTLAPWPEEAGVGMPTHLSGEDKANTLTRFLDGGGIASWAGDAMAYFVDTGVVVGSNNRLMPGEASTRAQMAQLLQRVLTER
jgi:hypothetical protein